VEGTDGTLGLTVPEAKREEILGEKKGFFIFMNEFAQSIKLLREEFERREACAAQRKRRKPLTPRKDASKNAKKNSRRAAETGDCKKRGKAISGGKKNKAA